MSTTYKDVDSNAIIADIQKVAREHGPVTRVQYRQFGTFSDRKIKTPDEFMDIEDIEFADQKSIVEVLAPIDTFDLAKLISKMEPGKAREKMLNCLPRAKRQEVDSDLSSMGNVDSIEATQIGQRIIARVKEIMLARS